MNWWFERVYDGSVSALSLSVRTAQPIDSSLPTLLTELDHRALRASSRATKDRLSYVSIPEEFLYTGSGSAITVGAAKGEDRMEDWLGNRIKFRKAFENVLSKLSVFSAEVIEAEHNGAPDLRKDGIPFIIESIFLKFFDAEQIPTKLKAYCHEWSQRVSADADFAIQIESIARLKVAEDSVENAASRFREQTTIADLLESVLESGKQELEGCGATDSEEDVEFATKFIIEASTNMLGLPFFELVYAANLAINHSNKLKL